MKHHFLNAEYFSSIHSCKKASRWLTRGVSYPKKLSSRTSESSRASVKNSAEGELTVTWECVCLDSVWMFLFSPCRVEGVLLTDFTPLDLSLLVTAVPKLPSRFCEKENEVRFNRSQSKWPGSDYALSLKRYVTKNINILVKVEKYVLLALTSPANHVSCSSFPAYGHVLLFQYSPRGKQTHRCFHHLISSPAFYKEDTQAVELSNSISRREGNEKLQNRTFG